MPSFSADRTLPDAANVDYQTHVGENERGIRLIPVGFS